jgi:hypothetical protein
MRKDNTSLQYMKTIFKDSSFEKINGYVHIKYGRLKRVMEYLYDEGVNFTINNNEIIFEELKLK